MRADLPAALRDMLKDCEADSCRCPQCVGTTIAEHVRPVLRRIYPPAGDCPVEIADALMKIGGDRASQF